MFQPGCHLARCTDRGTSPRHRQPYRRPSTNEINPGLYHQSVIFDRDPPCTTPTRGVVGGSAPLEDSVVFFLCQSSVPTLPFAHQICCCPLCGLTGLGRQQHIRRHFIVVRRLFEQDGRGIGFTPPLPSYIHVNLHILYNASQVLQMPRTCHNNSYTSRKQSVLSLLAALLIILKVGHLPTRITNPQLVVKCVYFSTYLTWFLHVTVQASSGYNFSWAHLPT